MKLDARALDAAPFSAAQLEALYDAIQVDDVIDDTVTLPASVPLDLDRAQLIDGFRVSRQLWRAGFDRRALIAMTHVLSRGEPFDAAAQARFKHVRAKFKHQRFAFVLYDSRHRCPTTFKSITTIMGVLQDAFRGERRAEVKRYAGLLRLSLGGVFLGMLNRDVDTLMPSDGADFRRFVEKEMVALSAMLERDTITGHQFHAARKVVSRQVSFHDDMRTIHSTPEHHAMARYLSAINGLMGRYHDELVLRGASGALDYAREGFVLPEDIRAMLDALVSLYR